MSVPAHKRDATGPWVDSVDELVSHIGSGSVLSVSGFHFTRAPMAALLALTRSDVKHLHYLAWGGGLPLEVLLEAGIVDEATICFSSLDVFGLAPRFRIAVESGSLRLHEMTALGMLSGLRAAAEKLDYEVCQAPEGSVFDLPTSRAATRDPSLVPMSRVPPLAVDVLLLHAQRADDDGNVEIQGARGLDLSTIWAARTVLVTVEERVERGKLGAPRGAIIPRSHVTALTRAAGGAHPTSCLPYYGTDFSWLHDALTGPPGDASLSTALGQDRSGLETASALACVPRATLVARLLRAAPQAPGDMASKAWTIDELMLVLLARTIDNASVCSMGSAALLAAGAYLLAKQVHAPRAMLMSHNGGLVDIAARPLSLSLAEIFDTDSAAVHTGGDDTYRWYYQAGRVTHEAVGAAQIDRTGATNNMWITRGDGSRIRLPGQGGMADVANLHRDFCIYLPRHDRRNTVEALDTVSASRAWMETPQRLGFGLQPGIVRVITNLGVLERHDHERALRLTALHPGVDLTTVRDSTGFDFHVAPNCAESIPPSREELAALRGLVDPLGVRRLDFVAARDRAPLIKAILEAERSLAVDPSERNRPTGANVEQRTD